MTGSIARYLKDFGEAPPPPPILADDVGGFDFGGDLDFPEVPVEVPVDIDAERTEAHAQGYEAGTAEAQRAWHEERDQLLKAHADELAATKALHEHEISTLVEKKMSEAALLIAEAVSDQTAKVLAPVVEQVLIAKAVADLAELLRAAILEGEVAVVTLRGPLNLFEKLTAALGENHATLLRHIEANDLDISAEIGDSAIVTRLSAWAARLREVLA
jgi:hypothetical protein